MRRKFNKLVPGMDVGDTLSVYLSPANRKMSGLEEGHEIFAETTVYVNNAADVVAMMLQAATECATFRPTNDVLYVVNKNGRTLVAVGHHDGVQLVTVSVILK